ncbi:MAG: SDR family oxidoreductase [Rhizobiaceae bacterium]|nr:SDR family oxidoreductase [Rhizobiaceae bacterium]
MEKSLPAIYPGLKGRSVFISGGASGIGEALVRGFAAQGASTAFVDIDKAAGEALEAELNAKGQKVRFDECDITDIPTYQNVIEEAANSFGPFTTLVNNAANDLRHSLEEVDSEKFDQFIAINLKHAMFAAQTIAPMMKKAGGGSIINFGSISWMMAVPTLVVYQACKAGTHGLTRALARDLGKDRIRVNTLVPGWVMTEKQIRLWIDDEANALIDESQFLPGRVMPDDLAQMALFLASDASAMCSGQNFIVDGGWV